MAPMEKFRVSSYFFISQSPLIHPLFLTYEDQYAYALLKWYVLLFLILRAAKRNKPVCHLMFFMIRAS